jgi:hypothetical protein
MSRSQTETWGIVGLGWLGTSLAEHLEATGHPRWGTHRKEFDFHGNSPLARPCDTLVLNTPPMLDIQPEAYADKVVPSPAERVIFISSTSVFGEACQTVSEKSQTSPDTPNGRWLVAVEKVLSQRFGKRLTVIRPGGLLGGGRHPCKHLAGKTNVPGGNQKINLIHRSDLVGIITQAPPGIPLVHAVAPYHPRKDQYYAEWATKLNLPSPHFVDAVNHDREILSVVVSSFYQDWKCPRLDFI